MKNKKGFTLIELLAVIVILGLLMAIAIPSVTKYITQSRKKTETTTIGNYISALTNQVNDMEYVFTATNTVYAVPIECIALERGGTDPFGEWYQASNSYWAYVLVQYDDTASSYTYGFTFKDSAGYGLYPTTTEKLNESGSQIQTGLNLNRPKGNSITNITPKANWTGFDLDDNTNLVVLEAASEGTTGNGTTTCTLCQKGKNYDEVNFLEIDKTKPANELPILMTTSINSTNAFWNYKTKIKTITFEDSINIPADAFKSWDVSSTGNGMVMAYIKTNASDSSYYDLYIQGDGRIYANPNSSFLFYGFSYLDKINNIELLNINRVTNMYSMFYATGNKSETFKLDLGDNFDTSNVTNMRWMFLSTGYSSPVFTLDLGDKFDTSKVTSMNSMFDGTGASSTVFTLDLGDKFDTSKVRDMGFMFSAAGYSNPSFKLNLGDKFDTSNVTNMEGMFNSVGYKSNYLELNLGNKFNTSKVTNMRMMFSDIACKTENFKLDLSKYYFDTSKVTNMKAMFQSSPSGCETMEVDFGNKFYINNVTDFMYMFIRNRVSNIYLNASSFNSSASNINYMFTNTTLKTTVYVKTSADKTLLDSKKGNSNVTVIVKN